MDQKETGHALVTDAELLILFDNDTSRAWRLFCEKYSDLVYSILRRTGFDYDEAMERFVYVFEKLCEDDFRRMKSVKFLSSEGDLTPWLRHVVKNFCVNWAWSENGRKRLFNFVAEMNECEQRVFQLFFWQGQTPFEIHETLRLEHFKHTESRDVFEALEKIFEHLSEKKLWRLISGLNRMRRTLSLDFQSDETGLSLEPADDSSFSPEEIIQKKESAAELNSAFETLSVREKVVVRFRYEESLTFAEIAETLGWDLRETVNIHKRAIYKLRKVLR